MSLIDPCRCQVRRWKCRGKWGPAVREPGYIPDGLAQNEFFPGTPADMKVIKRGIGADTRIGVSKPIGSRHIRVTEPHTRVQLTR